MCLCTHYRRKKTLSENSFHQIANTSQNNIFLFLSHINKEAWKWIYHKWLEEKNKFSIAGEVFVNLPASVHLHLVNSKVNLSLQVGIFRKEEKVGKGIKEKVYNLITNINMQSPIFYMIVLFTLRQILRRILKPRRAFSKAKTPTHVKNITGGVYPRLQK